MVKVLREYSYFEAANNSPLVGSVDGVVLHYSGGSSGRKTAGWAQEDIGRSWHFMVCRDGDVIQQVPLDKAAWHAGRSEWPHSSGETVSGANGHTIGIELANHGRVYLEGGRFVYELAGQLHRYHGEPPVQAELVFDNGVVEAGWWEPYPSAQISALQELLGLLEDVGVPMRLRGHEEIAVPFGRRKTDPGPLFPWGLLGRTDGRTAGVLL